MKNEHFTPRLIANLIATLKTVKFDPDGEPNKSVLIEYGPLPYPELVGYEDGDNVVLKVKQFEA